MHAMKHEDPDIDFAQPFLALAHHMRSDQVHALSILRKRAASKSQSGIFSLTKSFARAS